VGVKGTGDGFSSFLKHLLGYRSIRKMRSNSEAQNSRLAWGEE